MKKYYTFVLAILAFLCTNLTFAQEQSVARLWNEVLLQGIRNDQARPTVNARNLFHIQAAVYDAWAVYDDTAQTYLIGQTLNGYTSLFNGISEPTDVQVAREKAISYVAYRMITNRYQYSPGWSSTLSLANSLMNTLGFSTAITSTDYSDNDPAKLGNYIAAQYISYGNQDGSNQLLNYANQYYVPANQPLIMPQRGNPNMADLNRWQPLNLSTFIDQNGNPGNPTPAALSPEWGNVLPFSLTASDRSTYERDGYTWHVYKDQGPQAKLLPTDTASLSDPFTFGHLMVDIWSSHLTPDDTTTLDISPANIGNVQSYPTSLSEYPNFYNFFEGGDNGIGRTINPKTGLPYTPQIVKRGDYARILAEFWADGPNSETPPGHWFTLLNYVSDQPECQKRWRGEGPVLDNLEWDVRSYLAMGGAVHDAAICAWSHKGYYDSSRPVSVIRCMAEFGQSSDPNLPHYNPRGFPLIPGYIELVTIDDVGTNGFTAEDVNEIKLYTWKGHPSIADPLVDYAGVGWILAKNYWPYQRPSFVTPPFPGYLSGHSTYSRTAAEVMTLLTGDPFFPGGMGEFYAQAHEYLVFEDGPSEDCHLQWATYFDASDQCSLSRIWGGIHPPFDDIPGRKIGMELGPQAFDFAHNLNESGVARITSVTYSDNILSTGDYLSNQDVFFHFNEPMNTSVIPAVTFYGLDLAALNVLIPVGGSWVDNTTFKYTYTLNSIANSYSGITFRVVGGVAEDGGNARAYIGGNWKIDVQIPVATNATATDTWISDQTVAAGSFEVVVYFDKAMNTNVAPAISFPSNVSGSLVFNVGASYWSNGATFHAVINPTDAQEEVTNLYALVQYARDVAGNAIADASFADLVNIDTRNPAFIASSNVSLINDQAAGMALSLNFQFDEPMQLSSGSYFFSEGAAVENSFVVSDAQWTSNDTYEVTATAVDANAYFASSTAQFIGLDLHGNACQVGNASLWLIDTENPTVSQVVPSSNWFTGTPGWYLDVVFSEPMNTAVDPTVSLDDVILPTGYMVQTNAQWMDSYTFRVFYDYQLIDGGYFNAAVTVFVEGASDANANPMTNSQNTDAFGVDIPNLVEENGLSSLVVYPNPANDVIVLDGFNGITQVVVFDELGQVLYTNNHNAKAIVSVANWASGVYFVKSIQGERSAVTKLIVE